MANEVARRRQIAAVSSSRSNLTSQPSYLSASSSLSQLISQPAHLNLGQQQQVYSPLASLNTRRALRGRQLRRAEADSMASRVEDQRCALSVVEWRRMVPRAKLFSPVDRIG
jgi:hypothetical protein